MDTSARASVPGSDAELLNTIRWGDPSVFDVLRARHGAAARSLARLLLPAGQDADVIVAAAFAQVLNAITRGGGPSDAFRPYLLSAVRRVISDAEQAPADDQQIPDPGQPLAEARPVPIVAAFLSLPERWQAVLWHIEIERAPAADVAPLLGLSAAGVAELASRARDGLARAYRQAEAPTGRHGYAAPAGPADARAAGAALRGAVAQIFLGEAAVAYLAELAPAAARPGPAATVAAAGLAWLRAQPGALLRTRQQRAITGGAGFVLGIIAIAVSVLALGTPAGDAANHRHPGAAGAAGERSAPTTTVPTAHHSGTGKPGGTSAAPGGGTRSAAPSSTPPAGPPGTTPPGNAPPTARVTAMISVSGHGHSPFATVSFGVTDSGPAATARLAARISLPAGTELTGHGHGGDSGWSCTPDSGGAACAHGPIGAAAHAGGELVVMVTGSAACGQHVQVTVTGGSSPASAQSAGTIECHRHGNGGGNQGGNRGGNGQARREPPGWQALSGRWLGWWQFRRY